MVRTFKTLTTFDCFYGLLFTLEQEDSRGVTEDLPVHIQQCVRLHQVSTETSGWSIFLSSVPFPRLTVLGFSMETLSEMFQLEIPTVHSIISKMIINEELMVRMKPNSFI